jgi:hypothetical protein
MAGLKTQSSQLAVEERKDLSRREFNGLMFEITLTRQNFFVVGWAVPTN